MTAHPWKPTDPAYCRYFDIATGGYIGRLAGHVTAVGKVDAAIALNPRPEPGPRDR